MMSRHDHADAVKLGTFNIRTTAVGNSGRLRWRRRRAIIESLIRSEDPDILALQEVTNRTHGIPYEMDQLQWLGKTFPELEAAVGTVPHEPPADNPILVRRGRFRTLRRGFLAFDPEGGLTTGGVTPAVLQRDPEYRIRPGQAARHRKKSIASWAVLRARDWPEDIVVYNLHLDARSPGLRRRSAQFVIELITHLDHHRMPLMVLGDFNSFRGSPPVRALTELGLEPVIEANRQGTFHFGFGVTLWPRIDHILVSEELRILRGYIERHNHEGIYPSDHYPVFAEIAPGVYSMSRPSPSSASSAVSSSSSPSTGSPSPVS
ncbi:MAG: endonuclease/exonuclease/phosphatase family protein [Spirochaetaceae bacterium]